MANVIQTIKDQYYSQDGAAKIIIQLSKEDYEMLLKTPLKALQEIEVADDVDVQFVIMDDWSG